MRHHLQQVVGRLFFVCVPPCDATVDAEEEEGRGKRNQEEEKRVRARK